MKSWKQLFSSIGSLAVIVALLPAALQAEVKLPSIFGNHMVLQQGMKIKVWGWAEPGEKIQVFLDGQDGKGAEGTAFRTLQATTADEEGNWQVQFAPLKAGVQCRLKVQGKNNSVQFGDILVGEVWVCSGQSNMEWPVLRANRAKEEIAAANYPQIRLFNTPRRPAGTPQKDVPAQWEVCSPKTVGGFSAVAYFFGRHLHQELKVPIGLVETSWGGTRIEPWTPPVGFQSVPELKPFLQRIRTANEQYRKMKSGKKAPKHPLASRSAPTGLYNGMVAPIKPFTIRGAIWYQGESNRGDGLLYEKKMQALINGWRKVWGQGDFPFYYVQLAPFRYRGNPELLPLIWEAQTNVLQMKNTGMAVIVDIGNIRNIHPTNKQDVGKRLALWALAKDYGRKNLVYSGPLYQSHTVEGDRIRVTFAHVDGGLISRDGKPLSWFEVAGKDSKFVQAQAKIDGKTVIVWSDDVKNPVHVRFGWNQIAEPNLSNKAGLPASPFRSNKP